MFQNVLAIRESDCNSCFQLIYGILSQTPKKYTFQGSAHPYLQNDVILEFVLEFAEVRVRQNGSENGSEIAEHREEVIVDCRLAFIV